MILLAVATLLAAAQSAAVNAPPCKPETRNVANGVVVTVRSASSASPAQACEVLVRDRNGRAIFSDRGFNAEVHAVTGRDIDNDGRPDVVVGIDTAGGNDCCWEYPVISLSATPRVLLKLPPAAFDFETQPGKALIWTKAAFNDAGPDTADSPTVETVREFRASGFIDVTADYCKRMLAGELRGPGDLRGLLNALSLRSKQASRTDTGSLFDREQTRGAARSIALQQIYCGQIDVASDLVLEVWPSSEQASIRRQLKDAVNSRWPDLGRRLTTW